MRTLTTLLFGLSLALAACGGETSTTDPASDGNPPEAGAPADPPPSNAATAAEDEKLAALASAIRANPDDAAQLLADAGMTASEFESAMFAVARDPARSDAFTTALK